MSNSSDQSGPTDEPVGRADRLLAFIDTFVPAVLIGSVMASMVVEVVLRKLFNTSLVWIEEVGELAFGWAIFLGGACAFRLGRAITVDSVALLLPAAGQRLLRIIADAVTAAIALYLLIMSVHLAMLMAPQSSILLGVPKPLVIASLSAGMALILVAAVRDFVRATRTSPASVEARGEMAE